MKQKINPPPCSQKQLKKILKYNPETGIFYRLKGNNRNVKAGDVTGCKVKDGYVIVGLKSKEGTNKTYKAHKLAWYYMTGKWERIDHKNLKRDDNRFKNLRPATQSQNVVNTKYRQGSYLKGVSYRKPDARYNIKQHPKPFIARITIDGKRKSLGYYKTEIEAHEAYCQAAKKYYGEFYRGK